MTEATRPQAETDSKEPYSEHTPAMRQYLILRDKHPGVMLLYRIGDFYETFFDDAVKINRLIGLTLTKRGTFQGPFRWPESPRQRWSSTSRAS